jgi:hypothetical protein
MPCKVEDVFSLQHARESGVECGVSLVFSCGGRFVKVASPPSRHRGRVLLLLVAVKRKK